MAVDIPTTERPAGAAPGASRSRHRFRQFSLRGLFVLVTLLSVGLGWLSMKAAHARRQQAALEALGATDFLYDFEQAPTPEWLTWPDRDKNARPPGPAILRWLWGEHVLANIVALNFRQDDRCGDLTPARTRELAALDTLEYLALSDQPIGDHDLDAVRGLDRIKVLELARTRITDAGLERLSGMAVLKDLDISGTQISGVGLVHLRACKCLRVLDFSRDPITADGARAIGNLTAIEVLHVDWPLYWAPDWPCKPASTIVDEVLRSCARLRHLKYLTVCNVPVTDEGVRHLRGLPCLEQLMLGEREITDEGLAHIATLPRLRRLDISSNRITDTGLRTLRSAGNLESLDLRRHADHRQRIKGAFRAEKARRIKPVGDARYRRVP